MTLVSPLSLGEGLIGIKITSRVAQGVLRGSEEEVR